MIRQQQNKLMKDEICVEDVNIDQIFLKLKK